MNEETGGGASRSTDPASGSSTATDVSLREFVNERIQRINERFIFLSIIGGVIWFFIERHLTELNHENARVASVSENSVSSDTYEANEQQRKSEQDKLDAWRKDVDTSRTQSISREEFNRDHKTDKRAGVSTTTAIIATIIAGLILTLGILNYQSLHNKPTTPSNVVTVTTP